MGTTTPIRPSGVSRSSTSEALEQSREVLDQRLTVSQLLVLAPRLVLHALPVSSAAELSMQRRGQPASRGTGVGSVRSGDAVGTRRPAFSAELTAEDGSILGRLVLFSQDPSGFDPASRTTATTLASHLEAALRRAEGDEEVVEETAAPHPDRSPHRRLHLLSAERSHRRRPR